MNIYKKDFALIYDKVYKDKFYNDYTVFLKKIIEEEEIKTSLVLDIACGTGRLIKKIREEDIKIEGLDGSKDMVSIARKNNKDIKFYVQDFIEFDTEKKYNIITCIFDSINYIKNKRDLRDFFKNIKNHLEKEGIFIFDFNTIHKKIDKKVVKPNITYINEIKNRCWSTVLKIKNGKNVIEEKHTEHLYSFNEIKRVINDTGFKTTGIYFNFNKIKKTNKHQRLTIVLKKD